jgi:hypothetical protein
LRIIVLIIISILLIACKTAPTPYEQTVMHPEWIDNPDYAGYIGITTSAQPQQMGGIDAQRRVARVLARAEISRIKSTSVESTSTFETNSSNKGFTVSAEGFDRISTAQALRFNDVKVVEEWTHPETGELFMWLAYPMSN